MTTTETSTWTTKVGLARMLSGGVIMDVVTADQARIAQEAGAVAVMALERVPSDIRKFGGVARMSDPKLIEEIKAAVSIPVMAKCRIGHFVEAQILEALEVDYIDESEVLTPADEEHHIDKHQFRVPFVCGCRDLGEALRRIGEGAALIRTKGEAGTGNIVEAVRHMRAVEKGIHQLHALRPDELFAAAKELRAPVDVVQRTAELDALPVPNFSAGGVATPADAALMRQLIEAYGLREPILALARAGAPMLGTCAGMILLSERIAEGDPPVLPLLDIEVRRNAYGRQLDSFEAEVSIPVIGDAPLHGVFIRAPVVSQVGPRAEVLAVDADGQPIAIRQGKVLATAFHPELTDDRRLHRLLVEMVGTKAGERS